MKKILSSLLALGYFMAPIKGEAKKSLYDNTGRINTGRIEILKKDFKDKNDEVNLDSKVIKRKRKRKKEKISPELNVPKVINEEDEKIKQKKYVLNFEQYDYINKFVQLNDYIKGKDELLMLFFQLTNEERVMYHFQNVSIRELGEELIYNDPLAKRLEEQTKKFSEKFGEDNPNLMEIMSNDKNFSELAEAYQCKVLEKVQDSETQLNLAVIVEILKDIDYSNPEERSKIKLILNILFDFRPEISNSTKVDINNANNQGNLDTNNVIGENNNNPESNVDINNANNQEDLDTNNVIGENNNNPESNVDINNANNVNGPQENLVNNNVNNDQIDNNNNNEYEFQNNGYESKSFEKIDEIQEILLNQMESGNFNYIHQLLEEKVSKLFKKN